MRRFAMCGMPLRAAISLHEDKPRWIVSLLANIKARDSGLLQTRTGIG